ISNWTFSPPLRRSKSRDDVSPLRWKKYSFPSSAAMKPKPRSDTTFLMVPVVTVTSTLLEHGGGSRTVRSRGDDHTEQAHNGPERKSSTLFDRVTPGG